MGCGIESQGIGEPAPDEAGAPEVGLDAGDASDAPHTPPPDTSIDLQAEADADTATDPPDGDAAPGDEAAPDAVCPDQTTRCGPQCVAADDPAFGCGSPTCQSCTLPHAKAGCLQGACAVASCDPGWLDCDGKAATGCETDAAKDPDHCGSCGIACAAANGIAICNAGQCSVGACYAGYADCDADPKNGCEVHTAADAKNCGKCAAACSAGATCVESTCFQSIWTKRTPPASPPDRHAAGLVYDAGRSSSVLFGGHRASTGMLGDTWEWDGTAWTQAAPSTSPEPRYQFAMAYSPKLKAVVLFGGSVDGATCGAALRNDTWTWDGTKWQKISTAASPSPRHRAFMAWDAERNVHVLYGGSGCGCLGDTWEFDGTNWKEVTVPATPGIRQDYAMEYHAASKRIVLFGGNGCAGGILGDTWTYDGKAWQKFPGSGGPVARSAAGVAADGPRKVLVLYGGDDGSKALADTWEWNGAAWTNPKPPTSPPARVRTRLAYDAARARVLLFGGYADPLSTDDTWVYGGP